MSRYARYPSLSGRGVFVSGGASGIGAAIVRQFVAQGSQVATVDLAESPDLPVGVWYRTCDVRDVDAFQATIAEADEAVGPIRVLVNNVARDDRQDPATLTVGEWDDMLAVNLRHAFFAAQALRSVMAGAGGGSIVNFTSPSVDWKEGALPAYATSKAALYGLTRSMAGDLGPLGIRVNAVQPGWVFTKRQKALWGSPETEARVVAEQPIKRLATEDDVARMVLFLAADDSEMCTGHVYHVDGGWT